MFTHGTQGPGGEASQSSSDALMLGGCVSGCNLWTRGHRVWFFNENSFCNENSFYNEIEGDYHEKD